MDDCALFFVHAQIFIFCRCMPPLSHLHTWILLQEVI